MKPVLPVTFLFFSLCAAVFGQGATSAAKVAPQKKPMPKVTAAYILDKYVEVTGGKAAYAKINSSIMKGRLSISDQNINGNIEIYSKAPNKFYTVQDFSQVGKSIIAFDGKEGWSQDPVKGVRSLRGKELWQLQEEALFNSPIHWRELYIRQDLQGIRPVEGKDAYVIRLTPKIGRATVQYYDTKTFLIVRLDTVQESQEGTIPVESYLSDYRSVNGVKTAFKMRSRIGASELITEVTDYKNNVPIPDSMFAKPAK